MIAPVSSFPVVDSRERLLETVSASRLICFQQCRLKFYFRYVKGLEKTKGSALHIGSVVHAILQAWNMIRWRKEKLEIPAIKQRFDAEWIARQENEPIVWETNEEQELKSTAWGLLETYFQHTPIPLDEMPEGVEVSVEADLSKHSLPKLVGVIDLVRKGGRIVEFKTAGQTPNAEKAEHIHETQTSCYSVMYREATGKNESAVELHHLVKLKTPKLVVTPLNPMTQRQQSRLFRTIESYVNGIQNEDWVPSPNIMSCSCCEFFNECRAWH
jgi:CRISPR/Cas system-associated exonuclease Cas4 (RecB family)